MHLRGSEKLRRSHAGSAHESITQKHELDEEMIWVTVSQYQYGPGDIGFLDQGQVCISVEWSREVPDQAGTTPYSACSCFLAIQTCAHGKSLVILEDSSPAPAPAHPMVPPPLPLQACIALLGSFSYAVPYLCLPACPQAPER
jgi:hypothetical protein